MENTAATIIYRASQTAAFMAIVIIALFIAADPAGAIDYITAAPVAAFDMIAEPLRAVWALVVRCAEFPFTLI